MNKHLHRSSEMLGSYLEIVVLLSIVESGSTLIARKKMHQYCYQRLNSSENVCLTGGLLPGDPIKFTTENSFQNQLWVKNEHGYLISESNGLGIMIGNDYKCGSFRSAWPADMDELIVTMNVVSEKFDLQKKSMRWQVHPASDNFVNFEMGLSLHEIVEEVNHTTQHRRARRENYITLAVTNSNFKEQIYMQTSPSSSCYKNINDYIYLHKSEKAFKLCNNRNGEFCLSFVNNYVSFKSLSSSVVYLWETNSEGFVVSSENQKLGLDVDEAVCVTTEPQYLQFYDKHSKIRQNLAFFVELKWFNSSKHSMRWKLNAMQSHLVNEEYGLVLGFALDQNNAKDDDYNRAVATKSENFDSKHYYRLRYNSLWKYIAHKSQGICRENNVKFADLYE